MTGRDIVALLAGEARRRPIVADLLARAATLTDAEIEHADVPMKWYRQALWEARRRSQSVQASADIAKLAAATPAMSNNDGVNTKRGLTLEYTGESFSTKTQTGALFEIKFGDWLFFPEDGSGAWLNQTFFPRPPMQLRNSRRVGEHTRKEYIDAYMERLAGHVGSVPMTALDGAPAASTGRFTISR